MAHTKRHPNWKVRGCLRNLSCKDRGVIIFMFNILLEGGYIINKEYKADLIDAIRLVKCNHDIWSGSSDPLWKLIYQVLDRNALKW